MRLAGDRHADLEGHGADREQLDRSEQRQGAARTFSRHGLFPDGDGTVHGETRRSILEVAEFGPFGSPRDQGLDSGRSAS